MSITLNESQLRQALALVSDGTKTDSTITIKELQDGVYAWSTDYPEEGSVRLSPEASIPDDKALEDAFSSMIILLEHYERDHSTPNEIIDDDFFCKHDPKPVANEQLENLISMTPLHLGLSK